MRATRFRPTLKKLIAPLALILLSFVPHPVIQILLFGYLSVPLPFLRHYPLVYRDKPWFITPIGAVAAAIVWGSVIYILICLLTPRRSRSHVNA